MTGLITDLIVFGGVGYLIYDIHGMVLCGVVGTILHVMINVMRVR